MKFMLGLIIGALGGMWGYRYWLKTHPESLERLFSNVKNHEQSVKLRAVIERLSAKARAEYDEFRNKP